jgi:hypothetical protein
MSAGGKVREGKGGEEGGHDMEAKGVKVGKAKQVQPNRIQCPERRYEDKIPKNA